MVDIKQSDFNKDLDNYLFERKALNGEPKESRLFSIFSRKNKKEKSEEMPEELIEEIEEVEEEIKEMEEDYEDQYDIEKREGLLTRFFALLRGKPSPGEEFDEIMELDDEVKEVLKISFMWLNKLPAQHMREFKASGDFDFCKDLLIKHGIAKEKK